MVFMNRKVTDMVVKIVLIVKLRFTTLIFVVFKNNLPIIIYLCLYGVGDMRVSQDLCRSQRAALWNWSWSNFCVSSGD